MQMMKIMSERPIAKLKKKHNFFFNEEPVLILQISLTEKNHIMKKMSQRPIEPVMTMIHHIFN
jgi:hypothetical protein